MKTLMSVAAALSFAAGLCHAATLESARERRYLNEVFSDYVRTADVVFAEGFNDTSGTREKLTLRVFEPKGDTLARRPLAIITPGGAFMQHEDHWMDEFGAQLARAGYVVAINRYRLSKSIGTPEELFGALSKAVADQRAAIRFFLNDAAGANRFRIDPDNIFIGGHSAGAITSMHVAYLDQDEAPAPLADALRAQGAFDARAADEPRIRGVINLSGLVLDATMIDKDEPPLVSLHGDRDDVVPVDTGPNGQLGSIPIHRHAASIGLSNELHVIRGGLHNDTADPELCPECVPIVRRFMFNTMTQTPAREGASASTN